VLFSPWKRDATNNFRYVIYIVTTYLAFILAKLFLKENIKEIKLAKDFI
jgi:hypothetical protein